MAYAFTQDVPADKAFYARITDGLGDNPPPGLLVHIAVENPDGGLRYIDVWESEAAWQTFAEQRLHPVVHGLLAEIFGEELPSEPTQVPLSVIHVWTQSISANT